MAKKIGIINCEKIQDTTCLGCAKCHKAAYDKTFAFKSEEDVQIVFITTCGGCPGLVLPKLQLQNLVITSMGEHVDEIYFGTCVQKAHAVMNCPMNLNAIKSKIEESFAVPVTVGTHEY